MAFVSPQMGQAEDSGNVTDIASWTVDLQPDLDSVQPMSTIKIYSWYPWIFVWGNLFIIPSVMGNILTIVAYMKFPSLHNATNILICNQSFSDAILCVLMEVAAWFYYTEWGLKIIMHNKYFCLVQLASLFFFLMLSTFNILIITLERLVAVALPYYYYNLFTESVAKRAVAVAWLSTLLVACLPMIGWNNWKPGKCVSLVALPSVYTVYVVLLSCLIMLMVIAVFNITIASIAVVKRLQSQKVIPHNPGSSDHQASGSSHATTGHMNSGSQYKVTKMLLMVVGVFYIGWLPFATLTILFFNPPKTWRLQGTPEIALVMYEMSKGFLALNTTANPLIYAWRSSQFKKAFNRLLSRK